ncbi:MAG TPA: glycine cleavage system protein GcvH [Leucothrix mucor]|nr:glycine cleavage system protein GcvH [Leucothrix mucor]
MSTNIPEELLYTKSHEWIRDNKDGTVTIGITDHAQELLGDIVYVELPEDGSSFGAEDNCGVIESVKAASDFFSPLGGEVVAVNELLDDSPELVNSEPYGDGWIMSLKLDSADDLKELMDANAYINEIAE